MLFPGDIQGFQKVADEYAYLNSGLGAFVYKSLKQRSGRTSFLVPSLLTSVSLTMLNLPFPYDIWQPWVWWCSELQCLLSWNPRTRASLSEILLLLCAPLPCPVSACLAMLCLFACVCHSALDWVSFRQAVSYQPILNAGYLGGK